MPVQLIKACTTQPWLCIRHAVPARTNSRCVMPLRTALDFPTGHEDWDPYWARPWPSAAALAARLLQGGDPVAGGAVAELGAGLGLAGLAAALAGAAGDACSYKQCCATRLHQLPPGGS